VASVVPSQSQGKFYFIFSLSVNMSSYQVLCAVIITILNCPFVYVTVTGQTTSLTRDGAPQLRKDKQNIMLFACSMEYRNITSHETNYMPTHHGNHSCCYLQQEVHLPAIPIHVVLALGCNLHQHHI